MFRGFTQNDQYGRQQSSSGRKAPNSNVNIDNFPSSKSKKDSDFSGGEYVDYEEVK